MLNQSEQIFADVLVGAAARTAELLPMLMSKMALRDSIAGCIRHDELRDIYRLAQIALTRAKRNYGNALHYNSYSMDDAESFRESLLIAAEAKRNEIQTRYRSTPCTCYVRKR